MCNTYYWTCQNSLRMRLHQPASPSLRLQLYYALVQPQWQMLRSETVWFITLHVQKHITYFNKSTLDNSPPPNYDKESKDECHHVNNNPRYKWYVKPAAFQVIVPTRSNYGCKINVKNRNKSTILIFLPAIIELVQELLISNMHNKLEEDTCENVEVIVPTRSNYWHKMRKIAINRPFWIFFQPLLNLSKNYLLVTCITNLKRICEKLFKLSRPQGQIIDVKWEKSQ